ncbi:MAG: excinuclease ABC subunit UvrA [Coriobacteriia bacterium]|nr:excinuclease ABC subunit UvrA [Coriobacteriia bacterium]
MQPSLISSKAHSIVIKGARQGNLQNIDLEIPRNQLVVLTGLSGSGKSTLAIDLLFQECQRRYLEALGMSGIEKPAVDSIANISPAILISQMTANRNPRSTVGTMTGIYTDLRLIYEKLHTRQCPNCQAMIQASACREETEKEGDQYKAFTFCSECGERLAKLTSDQFSFNTREGVCPHCQGLGQTLAINPQTAIDETLSLEDGAVGFWDGTYALYSTESFYAALTHLGVPVKAKTPVNAYTDSQKTVLYHGIASAQAAELFPDTIQPKTVAAGKFEGVYTTILRRVSEKSGDAGYLEKYLTYADCPTCKGERLAEPPRLATVHGARLPELSQKALDEVMSWANELQTGLNNVEKTLAERYLTDLVTRVSRIVRVGLDYITLDRQSSTLSGGESQRLKLAAALDSELTGVIYILDEPTVGLHAKDTRDLVAALKQLRDEGNSVIVIEHDEDVMRQADYIIDIGPGSGKHGGRVIGQGSLQELMQQKGSVTGQYLRQKSEAQDARLEEQQQKGWAPQGSPGPSHDEAGRPASPPGEALSVRGALLHNLKGVDVDIPLGKLTVVTGVSGSGKTSLAFDVLGADWLPPEAGKVIGLDRFDGIVRIEQAPLARMRRSNVATYTGIWTEVRSIFAKQPDARSKGLTAKHFSFNTAGGRCEECGGLGVVESHMLFFPDADVTCPVCGGLRFMEDVLAVQFEGHSINGVLQMPIEEAAEVFSGNAKLRRITSLLLDVGLEYLTLGQTLTTLSGGEGQRIKLVKELLEARGRQSLYLMDEPTTGLHPLDVEKFLALLSALTKAGNTVVAVEHNLQLIRAADWVIDLGPDGGSRGGELMFAGTLEEMLASGVSSHTAEALAEY